MEEKETAVEDGNLILYYVRQSDRGVYQCNVGSYANTLIVLQVLDDDDKYNVVKPLTSHGPYPSLPERLSPALMTFIRWSVWSGCSRCGQVGRQRRYGYCYVRYIDTSGSNVKNNSSESNNAILRVEDINIFQAFPEGIPCKSNLLPVTIIELPAVAMRKNEIMLGLCKVLCKSDIFEVHADNGEVLERVNNSEGVFSLCQREPPQPPPLARDIIFAIKGATVLLKCPGTTLQDKPVRWRIGNKEVDPRKLDITTGGRIHLNARDHIVITAAEYTDSNVYSCWQDEKLSGVIKLKLFSEFRNKCGHRLTLLGLLCGMVLVHRALNNLYHCLTRGQ
ncbi:Ig-like V-type domain-containing protein FAM187A [Papilio machaon]|uniref:Ig-like V-type domain-containing protein FAM187A n=1 Tax=Papilio machaon TaxID=76193 RepID=A0A0N1IEY5_PAPMA|nr:Ig-like V-type domain-containing protein FAM187A [Papilio machaon]